MADTYEETQRIIPMIDEIVTEVVTEAKRHAARVNHNAWDRINEAMMRAEEAGEVGKVADYEEAMRDLAALALEQAAAAKAIPDAEIHLS